MQINRRALCYNVASVACLSVTYVLWLNSGLPKNCVKKQLGNGLWGIEWSRDWWRHMTLKGEGHGSNIFGTHYVDNGCTADTDLVAMEHLYYLWVK